MLNETISIGLDRMMQSTIANNNVNIWIGIFAFIGIFTLIWKLGSMIPSLIYLIAYLHGGIKWLYKKIKGVII